MNGSQLSRQALVFATLVFGIATSVAQETYATLIENQSEATLDTVPNTIVFHLSREFTGDTLADAARSAQSLAPTLRNALKDAGHERAVLRVTGPMIPDPEAKSIRIDAEIRMGLASTGAEGTRSTAFAGAVDAISKIAESSNCMIDGPALDVNDRSELEKKAVQRAIENAYDRAQAAATVMRLEIVSVDRVTIESVTWHDRPGPTHHEASAEQISVTVAIRIAYLALPPSN